MKYAVRFLLLFDAGEENDHLVRFFTSRIADTLHDEFETMPTITPQSIEVNYGAFPEGSEIYKAIERARNLQAIEGGRQGEDEGGPK